jgi:hypothetical protein
VALATALRIIVNGEQVAAKDTPTRNNQLLTRVHHRQLFLVDLLSVGLLLIAACTDRVVTTTFDQQP